MVRLVVGQGLRLAFVGILIEVAGAFALTRLMATVLFGVGLHDPITFGGVALLLVFIAAVWSFLPAQRASRVNPAIFLRAE